MEKPCRSGSGRYGYLDYVSAPGFVGTDTFTWAVSDGFATSSAPVTVMGAYERNSSLATHVFFSASRRYVCSDVLLRSLDLPQFCAAVFGRCAAVCLFERPAEMAFIRKTPLQGNPLHFVICGNQLIRGAG